MDNRSEIEIHYEHVQPRIRPLGSGPGSQGRNSINLNGDFLKRSSSTSTARSTSSAVASPADTPASHTFFDHKRTIPSPTTLIDLRTPTSPLKRPHPDNAFAHSEPNYSVQRPRLPSPEISPAIRTRRNTYIIYGASESWSYAPDKFDMHSVPQQVMAEYERLADDRAADVPPPEALEPAVWRNHFRWPNKKTTHLCECLMRYFCEELAPWVGHSDQKHAEGLLTPLQFDVGDPSQTFQTLVPQQACRNPALLNAVFTAASRHLVASSKTRRASDGVIQYLDRPLPTLTKTTWDKYLRAVIAYLTKARSVEDYQDNGFLAAAVILRFTGDIHQAITGEEDDSKVMIEVARGFIANRISTATATNISPYSPPSQQYYIPSTHGLHSNHVSHDDRQKRDREQAQTYLGSFEHACFRVTLRQEALAAIMSVPRFGPRAATADALNRPRTWELLDLCLPKSEQYIWADLHLRHLTDVLQFYCNGEQRSTANYHRLNDYTESWDVSKPYSFAPYRHPYEDRNGSPPLMLRLPECWLWGEVYVVGTQYLELARIILTGNDPSAPATRFGPERLRMDKEIRDSVIHICSLALGTGKNDTVFALEVAFAAVVLAASEFKMNEEQDQLLRVLDELESRGWPAKMKRTLLLELWGRL